MNFFLLVLLALAQFVLLRGVDGHVRIECPPPLSGRTGEKTGPCDVSTDDGSVPSFSLKPNALNTITWLESIPHPGAPVRFALSRDGGGLDESQTDFESCILLDHIPHDALSRPSYGDASTWHRSSITLWIPDVYCERCYLQLISAMSDAAHGQGLWSHNCQLQWKSYGSDHSKTRQSTTTVTDYPSAELIRGVHFRFGPMSWLWKVILQETETNIASNLGLHFTILSSVDDSLSNNSAEITHRSATLVLLLRNSLAERALIF